MLTAKGQRARSALDCLQHQQFVRLAMQRASERLKTLHGDHVAPALVILDRRKRHADGGGKLALREATATAVSQSLGIDVLPLQGALSLRVSPRRGTVGGSALTTGESGDNRH